MAISFKVSDFIYPYFIVSGTRRKETIRSFPGIFRYSRDLLLKDVAKINSLGLRKVLIFGIPDKKDEAGSSAYQKNNLIGGAVTAIKERFPEMVVMTDVCLCAYTSDGHCGITSSHRSPVTGRRKIIDSQKTLKALSEMALRHAEAGADWVAPSAMAKRQVVVIRKTLDNNGFHKTKILGYSAKFASNFYGPFRNAANSAPQFGDRRGYQLDFADAQAPIREIANDIEEGANMVMVKPALSYLDVIKEAKQKFSYPLAAYNVSGEYAFVKLGAQSGLWEEKKMVREILISIKRAGADFIITYHAKDIAQWLKEKNF